MPRRFLNRFSHIIVAVEVEHIRHKVERMLVVLHFRVQACEVEAVRQVLFVNLAEVLVPA